MIILALFITSLVTPHLSSSKKNINPLILFIVILLLELPLSLYGYEITPNASIPERLVVAGSMGLVAVLIAQGILSWF
jgi:hypothetical protein